MSDITIEDYELVERDGQDNWVVRLTTGKYEDTYYCYDSVKLIPPKEGWDEADGAVAELSFRYGLIESPIDIDALADDDDFNNYIGDVLSHIIRESFENNNYRIGEEEDGEAE